MSNLVLALLLACVAGAAAALLAHDGRAVYHDGLRAHVPDAQGLAARRRLAREGWHLSAGFIGWFALPTALLTGIAISHLVFLPADVIGLWARSRLAAAAIGAAVAGAVLLVVTAAHLIATDVTPSVAIATEAFSTVVVQLLPMVPVAAALRVSGARGGLTAGVLALAAASLAAWSDAASASFAATLAACIPLLIRLARSESIELPDVEFAPQVDRIRRSWPLLAIVAAGTGGLAGTLMLAGEPIAAWLVDGGHLPEAALLAVISAAAFIPHVTATSMVSGVYSTQGLPDWYFAPGYASRIPVIGAAGALGVLAVELVLFGRLTRWIIQYPEISNLGAAIRGAMDTVLATMFLLGAALACARIAPAYGLAALGVAVVLNELTGRRVPAVGIGPVTVIGVAIAEALL